MSSDNKFWKKSLKVIKLCWVQLPIIVLLLFTFTIGYVAIFVGTYETTAITNGAAIIMATLAALSFTYEKCLTDENKRKRTRFAGERMFHAAILVLAEIGRASCRERV